MHYLFIIIIVIIQYALADDYYCANHIDVSNYYGFDCRYSGWNWCDVDMCPMECDLCVYGESFMDGCGATSPGNCKPCTICGPGTSDISGCFSYVGYGSQDSTCEPCVAGFYSSDARNNYCLPCAAGTYSNAGSSVCDLCPPDTYQVGYGYSNECIPCETVCPSGFIKVACGGAISACAACKKCGPGTVQIGGCFILGDVSVDTICDVCGVGTYSDGAHNVECKTCPTGTYQTRTAASACLACGLCNNGYYPLGCGNNTAGGCLRCTNWYNNNLLLI
jgi:hypothetical protein